jgi:phosphoadenosine phosphosulfate reductase
MTFNPIRLVEDFGRLGGSELLACVLPAMGGGMALVSSFGAESAVLLHMVAEIDRATPVVFLDTGKLFWETRYYRSRLVDRLKLEDIRTMRPLAGDLARHDPAGELHKSAPDLCCHVRKTRPLERALAGFEGWISGRKQYHGGARKALPTLSLDAEGRLKADPLARMGFDDIKAYFKDHALPEHPLAERGYLSIGCAPCTSMGGRLAPPRAGGWWVSLMWDWGTQGRANGRPWVAATFG